MTVLRLLCFALPLLCWLGGPARADISYVTQIAGVDDPLAGQLHDNSQLVALQDRRPASEAALRRRADDDVPRLVQILHDAGYWAAAIEVRIAAQEQPVKVTLQVTPGPLYHLDSVRFVTPEGGAPPLLPDYKSSAFGLDIGGPALAAPVVSAEGRILSTYAERGHPFAKAADRRVVIDDGTHTMSVTYTVDAGPEARFGPPNIEGLKALHPGYVERRVAWHEGEIYDQREVETTRRALVDSNLFTVVQVTPAPAPGADGRVKMTISLVERLPRSVGVGADYSTSLGFGALAYWENRNLFGNAESLRVTTQFAQSQLGLLTQFRRPDLGATGQDLLATADLADETPEAYTSRRLKLSSGLERRFAKSYVAGALLDYEHGNVTAHSAEQHYQLAGVPLYVRRDTTNSLLDPTSGSRAAIETTPYSGVAGTHLGFVTSHLSGSAYQPIGGDDRLVLASYAKVGSIFGEPRQRLPADKLLYVGGGGSIRGYGYQLVGPLDAANKPFGGLSSLEFGAELRAKITDTIGLVPFIDAGNVYESSLPRLSARIFYGVGLGLRYYTPIGPIRLDLATPLSRRPSDGLLQVYISLGQAF
jgi:translocation and assembly module TamA